MATSKKYDYCLTLDNEDGSLEIIKQFNGTFEDAQNMFKDLVQVQAVQYRTLKTLKTWRIVRLFDAHGNLLAQES